MAGEFIVGDFESSLVETVANENEGGADKEEDREFVKGKFGKFEVCDDNMSDYIPCLDNAEAISKLSSPESGAKYERHCPENRKRLDCVVPRPKGYKFRVHWPESLDEVTYICRTHKYFPLVFCAIYYYYLEFHFLLRLSNS